VGLAGAADRLVRRPDLQGFLSQLALLLKARERGRTSFWWSLLQKKRSMPALAHDEQRWTVSTPQTSHGCATGSAGMLEMLRSTRVRQRCGSRWREGEEEQRSRVRRLRALAPHPRSLYPLLVESSPRATQKISPSRPRVPEPRSTPSLALAPPHQLDEHTPPPRRHRPRSSTKMSSEWDQTCLVCGIKTENRCSSCAKAGIDLFFCSTDHQKLVRPLSSSLPLPLPGAAQADSLHPL